MKFFGFKKRPEPELQEATQSKRSRAQAPSLQSLNGIFGANDDVSGQVKFEEGFETSLFLSWEKIRTAVKGSLARDQIYSDLVIKKHNGSSRFISVPGKYLRVVQKQLLTKIDKPDFVHNSAFGYIKGKSSVACAAKHSNANWLIKIDIRDFFHFIDEKRIFRELRRRGVKRFEALVIARLVTRSPRSSDAGYASLPSRYKRNNWYGRYKTWWMPSNYRLGYLPQGASTSGAVSNLVSYQMDAELEELARSHKLTYTRYADDIVISDTSKFDREFVEAVFQRAIRIVRRHGFEFNSAKTRIVPPGARLKVLGLLVGGKGLRLQKSFKKSLTKELYLIRKFGFEKSRIGLGQDPDEEESSIANRLLGKLVWASQIEPEWAMKNVALLRKLYGES